jgi:hypothetical protein
MICTSLTETNSPVETIAQHKELIVDVEVLRKALIRCYKFKGHDVKQAKANASTYISRAMRKYNFPQHAVDTIKEFKKACG